MRKTKAEAHKTRENLLKAALTVFYKRGVARASLDEIAKTAGVTRGALYWHFKNKEVLFDALFQVHFFDVEQRLDQALQSQSSGSPLLSLREGILEYFQKLSQDIHLKKFSTILYLRCEQTDENQKIVDLIQKYHQVWDQRLLNIFEQSKQQGFLPTSLNSNIALISLTSILTGLTAKWLSSPEPFDLQAYAPKLIQMYFNDLESSILLRNQQS